MSNFYVAFKTGSELPGSEINHIAYGVYNSANGLLSDLGEYYENVLTIVCDVDQDDEEELNQWYEDWCFDKEEYERFQGIVNECSHISVDYFINNSYFSFFNEYVDLVLITKDHRELINFMYEDFISRTGFNEEMDAKDKDYFTLKYPFLKYIVLLKNSAELPSEEDFILQMNDKWDLANSDSRTFEL